MNRWKEIAKFACGAEAFHTYVNIFLWFSGVNLTIFGITLTPTLYFLGTTVNGVITLLLGLYAWGRHANHST